MASAAYRPNGRASAIAQYLEGVDITSLDLWYGLDALSTHTVIDGIDVPVEGVVIQPNGRFTAVLNLYVSLQYGRDEEEGFITSDSFLAKIAGHLDGDVPVIEHSSVDTSSFYE